jgi:hypothetical protein
MKEVVVAKFNIGLLPPSAFVWRDIRKSRKASVKIVGVPVEIRMNNLPNKGYKHRARSRL